MEKYIYHYKIVGQVDSSYGGGSYNSEVYGDTTQQQVQQPATGSQQLANTGADVAVPVGLGTVMILASIVAIIKMRKGKRAQN